jgi:benzoylformate decarboxylase
MTRRARDVLLDILRDEGVTHVFGNPGSTEMPLMDALVDAPDIAYVLGLQEATAVAMADGWALASGRVGFVNLHAMGGLGNAMARSRPRRPARRRSSSPPASRTPVTS